MQFYCYRSRFKLKDRKKRHKQLIQAFQDAAGEKQPTQAILGGQRLKYAKMSLDLDAEVLIAELAPDRIVDPAHRPALQPRFHQDEEQTDRSRVYVIRAPNQGKEKPYANEKDLKAAEDFVNMIANRPISQADLEHVYKTCDSQVIEPIKLCPFLQQSLR